MSDVLLVEPLPPEEAADTDNWVSCLVGAELTDIYLERMGNAGFVGVEVLSATPLSAEGWRAQPTHYRRKSGETSLNVRSAVSQKSAFRIRRSYSQ